MNSLEEKLVKKSQETIANGENLLKNVKLLLANESAKDLQVLKSIGLDAHIQIAQKKQEDILIRSANKDKFGRNIVHKNEIKKLCKDYRLYLRRTDDYMGVIPPELAAELGRYCTDYNIPLPANSSYSKFMIIAPPKMFREYQTPLEVVKKAAEITMEERAERIRRIEEDPILVYKLDDNYFAIIKSWGEDFTPLRRFYGFMTRPYNMKWLNFLSNTILLFLFNMFSYYIISKLYNMVHIAPDKSWGEILPGLAILFVCIMDILFTLVWIFADDCIRFRRRVLRKVSEVNDPDSF